MNKELAIECIKTQRQFVDDMTRDAFDMAIKAMNEPKPKWIPVSERLPEEGTDVLISYRYKEGEGDTTHSYIDITSYGDMCFGGNPVHDCIGNKIKHWRQPFAYFTSNYEVIAWMPLPEPYKEGNNGQT